MQYVFGPGPALGPRTQQNTPVKTSKHPSRCLTACRGNDRRRCPTVPNRGRCRDCGTRVAECDTHSANGAHDECMQCIRSKIPIAVYIGLVGCAARATVADPMRLPTSATSIRIQKQVVMRTLEDSQLAVSIYPTFSYDTRSGGGVAQATRDQGSDRLQLTFDPRTVSIPDVSYRTAKFLGLPLPPFFRIVVHTRRLTGWLDQKTGQVQLDFIASFMFTASLFGWTFYAPPPLEVTTRLTTETAQGRQLGGKGARMDANGYARLVGVADVSKTGDLFMDKFLRLPANTFALMSSHFQL